MSSIARWHGRLAGSETFRTTASSALIVGVRVAGTAVTFAYTLLIARTMSPDDVGLVWSIWSASFIASTFATVNIGAGAIREVVAARAQGDDDLAAGFITVGRRVLLVASPLAMLGFYLFYRIGDEAHVSQYEWAFIWATISLPIMGWVQINASQAAALHKALYSQAPRELMRPLVFLAAFGAALAAGWRPTVEFAVFLYLVAVILTALVQYLLLRPSFAFMKTATPRTAGWRHWLTTGLFLIPSRIINEHLKNLFIVAASFGLAKGDTALFAVALSLITFLNFGVSSVDMTFSPKIAGAMAAGKTHRRDMLLAVSSGLKIVPIAAASVVLVTFSGPLLGLFGPTYVAAAPTILWFLLMPLSRAFFGPSDLVLQVAGHRTTIFWVTFCAIVSLVVTIPLAGQFYGLEAAAAAGSLSYAAGNMAMWIFSRSRSSIDTSVFGAAKVLVRRLGKGGGTKTAVTR
ncbi:lipopolysaccharide biosynthesis protein [Aurantimonas sp. Leaf443]|uniref:lipopolysaccharide biosynthesis protein n=1 Tax=Aurantimonas sp. Leaf443 TaxID=1736378 RepID=UPI0006F8B0D6|nr:lipopolysaccharide biosynthesis protein [Aurantimonas sp. Leaf443]KQT85077.1 hypothetical protein ASG48_07255 [Aurantimonas sp. Leaf443]